MAVLPLFGNRQSLAESAYRPEQAGQMFSKAVPPAGFTPPDVTPFVQDKTAPAPVQTQGKQPQTPLQQKAQAGFYGLQAAGGVTPTPDAGEAAVGAIGAAAQGAAMGASVGGVPGAVVGGTAGLVLGGLNAFMGMKSARKARDKEEALRADSIRMNKAEIARDEKWRVTQRLDSLEEARYQRKKYSMQAAYEASQEQGKKMMALIANNSQLKDKYAKMGWT